ncbi:hypothetical protein IQ218_13810 [Synechocystis salina LEGE 06099]|uniref:hypothetical protein n=1 Tax=Synechocystis salina TaxID=945780 RepID=UPI001882CC8E|nr:hypothetical protein [Synechocystis salina]MBE9204315.1 hypothetical protein [Synechocystis salina LEGE 06099]
MTCCIGKARIYYKEPLGFKLTYSGSANGTVTAQESLSTECSNDLSLSIPYLCSGFNSCQFFDSRLGIWRDHYEEYNRILYGPLNPSLHNTFQTGYWRGYEMRSNGVNSASIFSFFWSGQTDRDIRNVSYSLNIVPLEEVPKRFKVIGETTGTEYVNIGGLDECPAVENLGCVMGEEKHFDVEMSTPYDLIWLPNCIKTEKLLPDFKRLSIKKIWELPIPSNLTLKKIYEQDLKILPIIEGCPDPPVRVVCCPEGECEPDRCPPDTDCELDCGSFVCCYKNGKVIKTVRK